MSGMVELAVERALDVWEQCLAHPFLQQMGSGALPMDKFCGYLVDDSIYLREYARVFAYGMLKAESMEAMQAYYSLLSFVNETEDATRVRYLRGFGLTTAQADRMEPRPENRAYYEFMLETARQGGTAEIMMAVLPCMLSYLWLAQRLLEQYPQAKEGPFGPFLLDYVSPGYQAACRRWCAFAERHCAGRTPEEREELARIFRRSSEYELGFWQMSHRLRPDLAGAAKA